MRFYLPLCLLVAVSVSQAAPPVDEIWEFAQMDGARVGYVHTTTTADADGKILHVLSELNLTLKRYGSTVRLRMEQGLDESSAGKIFGVSMNQYQDKELNLSLKGKLEAKGMHVVIADKGIDRHLRWNDEVVGLVSRPRLWQEKKPRPGDRFTLFAYDPEVNTVVTLQVQVQEPEDVVLPTGRKKLTRIVLTPDKLEGPGFSVQRPKTILWLDDAFVPVRRQIELDSIGVVMLTTTTRELATAAVSMAPGKAADVGLKSLVALDRTLDRPLTMRSATYRIRLNDDDDAATAFASDAHQQVKNARGNTLDLVVHPTRNGFGPKEGGAIDKEYLQSNATIDSDDPRVKALARRAAGDKSDPLWDKAQRIERFVKSNLRVDNTTAFVPASQIAHDLRGDCRQSAVLTAALCRAEGIPSRVAIGLLYVEKARKPYLGFHMWTEVRIDGRWLGLDGTLGQGGVGVGHVKINDHSWYDVQSETPLLPMARVVGKMSAEIVRVE